MIALHPGTVATDLSAPFAANVATAVDGEGGGQLRPLRPAARQLLDVMDAVEANDAGSFFAWDGATLPW